MCLFKSKTKWDNIPRKLEYAILLKKVYDKHNFIAEYHLKTAMDRGDSAYMARKEETKKFRNRLKYYFGKEFDQFPGSYDPFSTVSFGNVNFDPYPIEKLQLFYDKIEEMFPEPFEAKEYLEKEISKKEILKYEKYPIFAKKEK